MISIHLKAEPYGGDVTDNNRSSSDSSPSASFKSFKRFTSFLKELRFNKGEVNNINSSSSPSHNLQSDATTYFDVTDNKTTDTTTSSSIFKEALTPSRRIMNENFCREDERLKTFENRWPLSFMDKNVLAQTGMYYTGIHDNVKCHFCEVEIGRWEITDHPVNEHMRWSPNCPLLRRRSTNNIPLDSVALDRILPVPSYDVCGGNEAIDIRPDAYAESSISLSENSFSTQTTSNSSGGGYLYPDHPEYAVETARLRSYAEWPRTMKQKPKELSEAGFFYTGKGDRVRCFSCGGGLKDWDESDDPWEQHALWLSNCKYLKLMKGKAYIDTVVAKYKSPGSKQESGNQTDEELTGGKQFEVRHLDVETATTKAIEATSFFEKNSEAKRITEEKLCKICYADEYNTAFLPCGHVVACAKCASSVTKCPVCRKPFKDVMRVYFS